MLSLIKRNKVLFLFLIIFTVLYSVTQFVHFNRYKSLIEGQFVDSDLQINIEGNIEFELFPLPHLELNKVFLRYDDKTLLSAGNINKGGLNPFNGKLNNLTIVGAQVQYPILNSYIKNVNDNGDIKSDNAFLEHLKFKNIKLVLSKDYHLESTTGIVVYEGDVFNLKLAGLLDSIPLDVDISIDNIDPNTNKGAMNASITADAFNLGFEGSVESLFSKNSKFSGKISGRLDNLALFTSIFDIPMQNAAYLENEQLEFLADFNYDERVSLDNIAVNSLNIKNLRSSINFSEAEGRLVLFEVDNIDLDGMFGDEKMNVVQNLFFKSLEYFNREIPKSRAKFTSKIHSITSNGKEIKDFEIEANVEDEIVTVSKFDASFPGGGVLKVDGVITHNDIRPLFQGEMNFVSNEFETLLKWLGGDMSDDSPQMFGKDLILKSEVIIVPHRLILNGIKGVLDEKLIQGKYYLKENRGGNFSLDAEFKISKLDLDKANLPSKLRSLLIDLAIADNDKGGEYFARITKDFLGLRRLRGSYDLDLEFGNLRFNAYDFEDFRASLRVAPGVVDVKSIAIKDEYSDFATSIRFTVPRIKPEVNFEINGKRFDKRTLDKIFPKYTDLINDAKAKLNGISDIKSASAQDIAEAIDIQKSSLPSIAVFPDLNSFGLTHIDCMIKGQVDELVWNGIELEEVTLDGYVKNAVFYLNELAAVQGNGNISLNGNLVLITQIPSTLLNFAFNNVSPSLPLYITTGEQDLVNGYFSVVGTLATSGVTSRDWGNKLTGKAQFAGKKIEYQGFDVIKIVEIPDLNVSYDEKIKRINYYQNYGSSIFDDVSGKVSVESGIATLSDGIFKNSRVNGIFVANYNIPNRELVAKSRFNFFSLSSNIPISVDISSSGRFKDRATTFNNTSLIEFITARANFDNAGGAGNNNSLLNSRLR